MIRQLLAISLVVLLGGCAIPEPIPASCDATGTCARYDGGINKDTNVGVDLREGREVGIKGDALPLPPSGDGLRDGSWHSDGVQRDGLKLDGQKKDGLKLDGQKKDGLKLDGQKKDGLKLDGQKADMKHG